MKLYKSCLIEKHVISDAFLHFINLYHFGLMTKECLIKICYIVLEKEDDTLNIEELIETVGNKISSLYDE